MSSNSEEIIHSLRGEFEAILNFIVDSPAENSTAESLERGLFYRLMSLGAMLLKLLFCVRDEQFAKLKVIDKGGVKFSYYGSRQRSYFSIFGKVSFKRSYFYQKESGGICPLDEQLSLPESCYSYWLREMASAFCVMIPYNKVVQLINRLFNLNLSTRFLQEAISADAKMVESFYDAKGAPSAKTEAEILVISADGKGIPMTQNQPHPSQTRLGKGEKPTKKKEAVVTTVYTITPRERTPAEVVESLFKSKPKEKTEKSHDDSPCNKHLWATLDGKDAAFGQMAEEVSCRDGGHITDRVAITDGCPSLQKQMLTRFDHFCLILDIIHVVEYLWKAANAWLGENHKDRAFTVAEWTQTLLSGNCDKVIDQLDQIRANSELTKSQRTALEKVVGYLLRNQEFMDYDQYLAQGWPIASGVIEGACRHLVKDRFELSGMRWTQPGAEALLKLRCVHENEDWQEFHHFLSQKCHQDLYGSPPPQKRFVEEQCFAYAA